MSNQQIEQLERMQRIIDELIAVVKATVQTLAEVQQ